MKELDSSELEFRASELCLLLWFDDRFTSQKPIVASVGKHSDQPQDFFVVEILRLFTYPEGTLIFSGWRGLWWCFNV